MSHPAALIRPQAVTFADALPDWPCAALPTGPDHETLPDADEHRARVAAALQRLQIADRPAQGRAGAGVAVGRRGAVGRARPSCDRLVAADPAAYALLADLTAGR